LGSQTSFESNKTKGPKPTMGRIYIRTENHSSENTRQCNNEKKVYAVMVNNCININKMNNHLYRQTTEHKNTKIYSIGFPGLKTGTKCGSETGL
jgi:hypothetical protein